VEDYHKDLCPKGANMDEAIDQLKLSTANTQYKMSPEPLHESCQSGIGKIMIASSKKN
jgi:hypothetical protein